MTDQPGSMFVEHQGIFMMIVPVGLLSGEGVQASGLYTCMVFDTTGPRTGADKRHWTVMPVLEKDGRPAQFATAKEAIESGFGYGELWIHGRV